MANLAQIYDWFMTDKKPTQAQFWASWGSFWNKEESIPQSAISNLSTVLNAKTENDQFNSHKIDVAAHAIEFNAKEDKNKKGVAGGYAPLSEANKIPVNFIPVINYIHNQNETESIWIVTHSLGKYPAVCIIDETNRVVEATVRYIDNNSLEIIFSEPFSGRAICN